VGESLRRIGIANVAHDLAVFHEEHVRRTHLHLSPAALPDCSDSVHQDDGMSGVDQVESLGLEAVPRRDPAPEELVDAIAR
jgi:hypothetical protein